ncbi:MAG: class I SAM-dependent methyltransferase [Nanoarchaeota archaeon]|nr:class I SAM-dependent methyltransferase [Nanoarchaeota archaeon]
MNQKQVWNNLAEEWYNLKNNPIKRVLEFLKKQRGKVLDLGSGAGRHLIKIKDEEMYLVDFSEEMIKLAKKKSKEKKIPAKFFVSDMTKLPFKDNFFDAAIITSSLHCIKRKRKREKAVMELFRVLKPKARVFVTVYNKNSEQFRNSPKEKYIRWKDKEIRYYYIFDEKEIYKLFEKAGFKIVKIWEPKRSIEFIAEKFIF